MLCRHACRTCHGTRFTEVSKNEPTQLAAHYCQSRACPACGCSPDVPTCLQQADPGGAWDASALDALELSALGLGDAGGPIPPQASAWSGPQPAQGAQPAPHACVSSTVSSSLDALELSALGLGGRHAAAHAADRSGLHLAGGAQAALHESFSSVRNTSLAGQAPPSAAPGTADPRGGAARVLESWDAAAGGSAGAEETLADGCTDVHDAYPPLADGSTAGAPSS